MTIIIKHSLWRFWRRSCWGLNPFAWILLEDVVKAGPIKVDGYRKPGDGLGGFFEIRKEFKPQNCGDNVGSLINLDDVDEFYAERVISPDTRKSWQKPGGFSMFGWQPFYKFHDSDLKWFGG